MVSFSLTALLPEDPGSLDPIQSIVHRTIKVNNLVRRTNARKITGNPKIGATVA
jgi:hypothetical protein